MPNYTIAQGCQNRQIVLFNSNMTAQNVIEHFKALPPKERAEVAKFVIESDDSWIPDSFKRGVADATEGRFAKDMETVMNDAPPPSRQRRK